MASGVYTQFPTETMKGTINCTSDTLKCALLNNSHSYDPTNTGWASVSANEISGSGYTAGGKILTNVTVTQDDTNNRAVLDADDVEWTAASFSAYHAVIYDDTPINPADPLICSIDFGGVQTVSSGTFRIEWDSEGILNSSV